MEREEVTALAYLAIRLIRRGVRNDLAGRDASKADEAARSSPRRLPSAWGERIRRLVPQSPLAAILRALAQEMQIDPSGRFGWKADISRGTAPC